MCSSEAAKELPSNLRFFPFVLLPFFNLFEAFSFVLLTLVANKSFHFSLQNSETFTISRQLLKQRSKRLYDEHVRIWVDTECNLILPFHAWSMATDESN